MNAPRALKIANAEYRIQELERTVAELRYYASHAHLCNKDQTDEPPRPCDCGLDALLARLDGGKL